MQHLINILHLIIIEIINKTSMKGLILSFFGILLCYSLFFDAKNFEKAMLLHIDSEIKMEKANLLNDTTNAVNLEKYKPLVMLSE